MFSCISCCHKFFKKILSEIILDFFLFNHFDFLNDKIMSKKNILKTFFGKALKEEKKRKKSIGKY